MRKFIILLCLCMPFIACEDKTPLNHDLQTSTVYLDHAAYSGQEHKDLFFSWTDPTLNTEAEPMLSTVTVPFTVMVAGEALGRDLRFNLYQSDKNADDTGFFAPLKGYPGLGKSYVDFTEEGFVLPAGERSVTVNVVFLHDAARFGFYYYESGSGTVYDVAKDGYIMTFGVRLMDEDAEVRVSGDDFVTVRINKGYN